MFEDDRIVVSMDRYENDVFNAYIDLRVAVRDASSHVLVTSAEQAAGDPREAILLKARMDCVTAFFSSNLSSFDIQDTGSQSHRLFNQLDDLTHHLCALDMTMTHMDDGAIRLSFTGDPLEMKYDVYEEGLLLAALTLTDLTGTVGRTEVFYLNQPDAFISEMNTSYTAVNPPPYFHLYGARTYYHDGYAYLSLRFNVDNAPTDDLQLRLTSIDGSTGNYSETSVYLRETEYMYYQVLEARYHQAVLRVEDLPEQVNYMTVQAYEEGSDMPLFEVNLKRSSLPITPSPTVPPTATPSPTPTATPIPTPAPTEPPYNLAKVIRHYRVNRDSSQYLHYACQLRAFDGFSYLNLYFREGEGYPEGAIMRITNINGEDGNFGEAAILPETGLSNAPADLLGVHIRSEALGEELYSATIQCITPDGEVIVTLTLGDVTSVVRPNPNEPTYTPSPTTRPTATPDPAKALQSITLSIQDKPVKYSHYNAFLNVYTDQLILLARFRYHDPLPHGTNLRLTAINGVPGDYGEAPILAVENHQTGLLIAEILISELPEGALAYTIAAYAPDTEEPIFEVALTSSQPATNGWSGGNWYAPGGDVYYPMATPTRTPYNILDSLNPIGTPLPGQFGHFGDISIFGP